MIRINSEILKQFHYHGIPINKGVAVDAILIKSASKPISKKQIKELTHCFAGNAARGMTMVALHNGRHGSRYSVSLRV